MKQLPRYYNVHTHLTGAEPYCLPILNRYAGFETATDGTMCSLGLHPWYLENAAQKWPLLQQYAALPHVLAIGECGLDKVRGADWNTQRYWFGQQILLANELKKPLIIHCVRAYDEALQLLQQAQVPVIFHGFNKKMPVARQVLDAGHWLSFGAALLDPASQAAAVLSEVPQDRFFLETDDAPVSIGDLYTIAAEIRKTDQDAIILQLQQNFKTVFQA